MNSMVYSNNFLLLNTNSNYEVEMIKICLNRIMAMQKVLLMTKTSKTQSCLLALMNEMQIPNELLKNFIVIKYPTIEGIISKLLELHAWVILPDLLIVDLIPFITMDYHLSNACANLNQSVAPKPLLQTLCFCIATIFSFINAVESRKRKSNHVESEWSLPVSASILVLREHEDLLTRAQIELLINLYFYNNNAFGDFQSALNTIEAIRI